MLRCPALLVLLAVIACGGSRPPAADPAPIEGSADPRAPEPEPVAELCCCTFDSATLEDFPDVNTWDSMATTCATGDGARLPGQCIAWSWCDYAPGREPRSLAERPDLAPRPPIPDSACCCDIWDGHGETFSVLEASACAQQQYGACVDAGFCS